VAGLSAGWLVGRAPTVAHAAGAAGGLHGVPLQGMDLTSKDRLAEGRFGVMFKRLPAFTPRDDLLDGLARTMVEDQTVPDDTHLNTSPRLFAGFTFTGQFIDHDITFDNTPLALQRADPDATVNFRTPRYDLDSIYGRGPANEPLFYDPADRDKLLVTPFVLPLSPWPSSAPEQRIASPSSKRLLALAPRARRLQVTRWVGRGLPMGDQAWFAKQRGRE
jgi:hypothetical protein